MLPGAFDNVQLSSIKLAVDRLAEGLEAENESIKLAIARAVFNIAAEANVFDTARLVEMARTRLAQEPVRQGVEDRA